MAAEQTITESLSIAAYPPVEGTPTAESTLAVAGAPEGELQFDATETAAEPTVEAITEAMATTVAEVEVPAEGGAAPQPDTTTAAPVPAADTGGLTAALLRPVQIGLGVLFLVLLILWLILRRRVRSL
jgi:hypothetical protein